MSKFEFVNHSCIILSHNNISLAMDPWIEGSVFNNSWDLLSKTPEKSIESLKKSQFIWFSHEHPDHFNPPNLKIFSDKNNFLFQKTVDKRVVKFLSKISPNVKEIDFKENFQISQNFSIQVVPFQYLDSMSIVRIENLTILNLNDCDIKNDFQLKYIKDRTGPIDVLLVQFSYAIGKSNRYDKNEREKWSNEILSKLSKNIQFLKPKVVIPFASFCYFSKQDNFYMNDSVNDIESTINYLSKENPNVKFFNRNNYKILFRLTDLNKAYLFSFDKGLVESNVSYTDKPWCSLSSQSLMNLFTSGYGYDSLIIGGRFESNSKGLNILNKIFKFQAKNYQNIYYNFDNILNSFFKKIFKTFKIFNKR